MNYQYIVSTPGVLGGKPCIKGTRISVELILETIANGASVTDIVNESPRLSAEAVQEAIRYAYDGVRKYYRRENCRLMRLIDFGALSPTRTSTRTQFHS